MSLYVGLAVAFLGALAQATLLPRAPLLGVTPDVVVVAVAGWALVRRFEDALTWAVLGGLSLDMLTGGPFGASVAACAFAVVAAAVVARRLRPLHHFLVALAVPVAVLVYYAVALLLLAVGGFPADVANFTQHVLVPALIVDAVVAVVLLPLLYWVALAIADSEQRAIGRGV